MRHRNASIFFNMFAPWRCLEYLEGTRACFTGLYTLIAEIFVVMNFAFVSRTLNVLAFELASVTFCIIMPFNSWFLNFELVRIKNAGIITVTAKIFIWALCTPIPNTSNMISGYRSAFKSTAYNVIDCIQYLCATAIAMNPMPNAFTRWRLRLRLMLRGSNTQTLELRYW